MSKKLIYNFGSKYGFFSEFNNMVLCYLYCLCNEIEFILFDGNSRFAEKHDYLYYFEPFCKTDEHTFNLKYNKRDYFGNMGLTTIIKDLYHTHKSYRENAYNRLQSRLFGDIYKFLFGFDFYTYEIFAKARNRKLEKQYFKYEPLEIDGDLQSACKKIIERIWTYKPDINLRVRQYIDKTNLNKDYLGIHIRGGDKILEYALQDVDIYISTLEKLSDLRTAFVLTDDFKIFETLERKYPNWNFKTLCDKSEHGYFHDEFISKSDYKTIQEQHIKLFASMDILSKSELFVGTYSSNPGMYLGMKMDKGKTLGIDFEDWRIW